VAKIQNNTSAKIIINIFVVNSIHNPQKKHLKFASIFIIKSFRMIHLRAWLYEAGWPRLSWNQLL